MRWLYVMVLGVMSGSNMVPQSAFSADEEVAETATTLGSSLQSGGVERNDPSQMTADPDLIKPQEKPDPKELEAKTKRMMMLKGHPQDSTVSATPEEKPDPKELEAKTKRMMMLKGHPQDSTVSATPEEKPDPKELEAKTKRAIMRMNGLFTSASAVPTEDERIREHGGKDQ